MHGFLASGFERVGTAFQANFIENGELGAAFAAVRDGVIVCDIWGGTADRATQRPWTRDTLQLIFSGTKGLVATCIAMLIERGKLELDEPVARYWPEFGKENVNVGDVVSHQARLPGIETPSTAADLTDDVRMGAILAAQPQSDDPRARFCYHALTYGWLCGELVRRVDGRSIGRFFADEIAGSLGLDAWIGLPASQEARVSTLELAPSWGASPHLHQQAYETDALLRSAWGNPVLIARGSFPWNQPSFHRAEIPGANGIADARSVARLYGALARGGAPILSEAAVRLARQPLAEGRDELYGEDRRFAIGFQLQVATAYGPPPDAFGHGGAGGSLHGAWPTEKVGYSYCMNLMQDGARPDPRPARLLEALYASL
jgi:CubicO group peptidase (beta-lactamase class C family)